MDFEFSARSLELQKQLRDFIDTHVVPAEPVYRRQVEESGDPHFHPPVMEDLKTEARRRDLWNLFLPNPKWGSGLSNLDYAPLCELMGRVPWSPCSYWVRLPINMLPSAPLSGAWPVRN